MIRVDELRALLNEVDGPVLSLYLRVSAGLQENQASNPAWETFLKNALRDIERDLADEERDRWKQVRARVEAFFQDYRPASRGLVLFAGAEAETVYPLPVMPHENSAHYGEPEIAPLIWLLDEYEPYLVVLVDSEEAHFLLTYLGDLEREETMESDRFEFEFREKTLMPRPVAPGSEGHITAGHHRDAFDDKMNEWIAKFHRDVAARARELLAEHGAKRLILGGSQKAAHAVQNFLHDEAKACLVGVLPIPLQETERQVMQRVLPAALEYERQHESALVKDIIDLARSRGRGALGAQAVGEAVQQGRVELLVAPWPPADLPQLGQLTRTALANGSAVELVHGAAAEQLEEAGGIGARLYYAL